MWEAFQTLDQEPFSAVRSLRAAPSFKEEVHVGHTQVLRRRR